ncbi:MAG: DUF2007 domain-containing protein [Pseudomonadota bacterium]
MKVLLATNNLVTLSLVETLLKEAGIESMVLDQNMSVLEGSIGIIPRRLMVPDQQLAEARVLMEDAGLQDELKAE